MLEKFSFLKSEADHKNMSISAFLHENRLKKEHFPAIYITTLNQKRLQKKLTL